jgi:hypothetical protein
MRILLALAALASAVVAWHISRGDYGVIYICTCDARPDPDCTIHQNDRSER